MKKFICIIFCTTIGFILIFCASSLLSHDCMDSLRIWKVKNISPVSEEVIWKYDSFGYDFVVTADRLIFLLHTDDFYLRDEADVQYFTSYAQYAANAVDAYLVKSGAKQWINEECFAVTKKTYYEGNDISHTVGESIYINRYLFQ